MAKEYIDREALNEEILHGKNKPTIYDGAQAVEWIEVCIKNAPTADVQEVRHGKWIYVDGVLDWADYKCSECGYIEKFGDYTCFYNYCPHCGAKMDKEI